jgi:hypothetical protein
MQAILQQFTREGNRMSSNINVTSEIGRLKKVMLHRPGGEVENLVPEYLGRLLFDDIPYLKVAKQEHDGFADVLRGNGVEVLYLEDLLAQVLEDSKIKKKFVDEFLKESGITSSAYYEALSEYFLAMPTRNMIDAMMTGVRKGEVEIKRATSLADLMMDEYPFHLDPMPVAAHADRDAGLHRQLERAAVLLHALGRRLLAVPMLEIAGVGFGCCDGWAQRGAAIVHQLEHFGGAAVAVLDRVGPGEDGAAHSLSRGGVHGDEPACVVSGRDAGVEFGLG